MANCLASCQGDGDETHRLGRTGCIAKAQTWNTFAVVYVDKYGAGYLSVRRASAHTPLSFRYDFGPEDNPDQQKIDLGAKLMELPTRRRNKLLKEIDQYIQTKQFNKVI